MKQFVKWIIHNSVDNESITTNNKENSFWWSISITAPKDRGTEKNWEPFFIAELKPFLNKKGLFHWWLNEYKRSNGNTLTLILKFVSFSEFQNFISDISVTPERTHCVQKWIYYSPLMCWIYSQLAHRRIKNSAKPLCWSFLRK